MQTISEEKLSFPRPCEALAPRLRGGKLRREAASRRVGYRRESKAYWRRTKSAINYVHLLICRVIPI